MSAELTPEQIRAWGKASRAAAGVPPKISDPAVLGRLVVLAFAGNGDNGEKRSGRADAPAS